MKYNIQCIDTNVSEDIKELVANKLYELARKYRWIIYADVFFKQESKDSNKGSICEIKVSGHGPLQYASSNEPTFELAVSATIKDLTTLLKKRKDIMKRRDNISYKSI